MTGLLAVALAFAVGSIPWGYLAGRMARGIDLRTIGSGGTGATNVLRTLGARASATVFILDFLKGFLPAQIALRAGLDPSWTGAIAVATVAGHCWSPFIGFKGGKGVATGAGAAIALFPLTLLALPVMALVVWRTRYVSLGSLVGASLTSLLAIALMTIGRLELAYALAILAISAIIVLRHRENIDRLADGTERRVGESVRI